MSDAHEQSYYEIALTNRQVLVAFVILLSCVMAAFFAGVWVGRGAPRSEAFAEAPAESDQVADEAFEDPKEFEFFADQEGKLPEARPDLREIAENPDPDTTLAQDLGVEPKPPAAETEPAGADTTADRASEDTADDRPAEGTRKAPPAPPEPRPETGREIEASRSSAADEVFVIQVFSSRDEVQARRLVTRLQEAGFKAFLSPLEADRMTMYRVRLGPYPNRGQAESIAASVRDRFKVDTWITSP